MELYPCRPVPLPAVIESAFGDCVLERCPGSLVQEHFRMLLI